MPWGKMDDKFHRNEKIRKLRRMPGGREALGVWVFWWSWCLDDHELTGEVPKCELAKGDDKGAKLLVEVGLWEETEDAYHFHDFQEYNPTKEQIDAKREADRERQRRKRERESGRESRRDVDVTHNGFTVDVASTRDPLPNPTQPDPTVPRAQEDRVEATGTNAGHWLAAFGAAWANKRGWLTYGGGASDATACASLQAKLDAMPPDQRADVWSRRESIFAAFLASTDPRTVQAGHSFAFFVPRFLGLIAPPQKAETKGDGYRKVVRGADGKVRTL